MGSYGSLLVLLLYLQKNIFPNNLSAPTEEFPKVVTNQNDVSICNSISIIPTDSPKL